MYVLYTRPKGKQRMFGDKNIEWGDYQNLAMCVQLSSVPVKHFITPSKFRFSFFFFLDKIFLHVPYVNVMMDHFLTLLQLLMLGHLQYFNYLLFTLMRCLISRTFDTYEAG